MILKTQRRQDGRADMYLEAEIGKMQLDGIYLCTTSGENYVNTAVQNMEDALSSRGHRLHTKCYSPLSSSYRPELDTYPELKADGIIEYMEPIGVRIWAVELGRVDINLEVSLMSSYMAAPSVGHLQQLYHMFGYLC